jgi:hypothetical protein
MVGIRSVLVFQPVVVLPPDRFCMFGDGDGVGGGAGGLGV